MPLRLLYQEENAIRPDVGFDPIAHIASKRQEALDRLKDALNEAEAAIAKLRSADPALAAANSAIGREINCIRPDDKVSIAHPSLDSDPDKKCLYMWDGRDMKSSLDCGDRAKKYGTFKFERV